MKIFDGKKNFSVFSKILMGFLLVVAPLYFFSIQVNIWGQNDIKKEIIESYKARAGFYLASLENEFSSILGAQTKMIVDADLLQLATAGKTGEVNDYPYFNRINTIRKMLSELKATSSLVEAATVYIPSISLKISNAMITDMQEKDFSRVKAAAAERALPFSKMEDGYYINITSSDSYLTREGASIDFIICVRLSMDKVERMLGTLSAESHSRAILVGGSHGLDVAQKSEDELTAYFKEYIEKQNIKNEKVFIGSVDTAQGKFIFSYSYSQFLDSALIVYELEENIMGTLLRHRAWLWIMSLLTFIMIFAFSVWIRKMITHPLNKLLNAFKKVEGGKLDISVNYHRNDEFGALYDRFNEMFQKLRILIEQVFEQKIRVREAELKQLQYQINPHFLYNNILTVSNLIKMSDFECAQKLTQHLGKYYQYITKTMVEDVPLQKEMNHMRDYIEIQTIRFQSNLRVEVDELPAGYGNRMVPRLILQPIVENAFKYGLREKMDIGRLRIRIRQYDAVFSIFIEDNGDCLSDGKLEEIRSSLISSDLKFSGASSALINVHRRIRIKFGRNSGLWVTRGEMGGLCVEVRIEWGGAEGGNDRVQLIDRG